MVSNTVFVVAGCSSSRKNASDILFFRLPNTKATDRRSEELSKGRIQWLAKSNCKGLTAC